MRSSHLAGQPAASHLGASAGEARKRGRWLLIALALVCMAPMLASYFTYYVIKPRGGATNYGMLVEPQRPIPQGLAVVDEKGVTVPLATLRGVWVMLAVDRSACDESCVKKLYFMRQVRATQSGERHRLTMAWLRTDAATVPAKVHSAYPETRQLIADEHALAAWLPADAGERISDYIYLIDPSGNLMMRFPKNPNPSKIKSDVTKLLKWSSMG